MEWTAEVSAGDWVRDALDHGPNGASSMHGFVPRGFAAYARIFHPSTRDRPVGIPWPPEPADQHSRAWEAFQSAQPEIDTEPVTWSQAADAFGTSMHALAQWHRLVRQDGPHPGAAPTDAAGWRYAEPAEGHLDPEVLAAAADVLAAHTTTPDDGFIALWEGWGGVVGAMGWGPSPAFVTIGDQPATDDGGHHERFLATSTRDAFNDVFRKPTWQPGILSDEISKSARLSLPSRDHVLFRGGAAELATPQWVGAAPWRDRTSEEHGFSPMVESPSLVWPADRAWVLVTEIDADSTVVGGSSAAITALCADDRLEALPLRAGADLSWDGDRVNGGTR